MVSPVRTIVKNALSLMTGRLVSRVLQFILFIYATRVLGPVQFGVFSFAYALTSIMAVALDLGAGDYTVQQLSRDMTRSRSLTGTGLVVRGFLIGFGLVLVMAVGYVVEPGAQSLEVLVIMGFVIALDSLTQQYNAVFLADERMEYQALIVMISNGTMSLGGLALMYFFPVLHLFAGVFLFGAFLRFALSRQWFIRKYGRPVYQADRTQTLEMLRQGLPFALVSVFVTLYYYIDTVILTIFVDKEVVGQYNAAFRLLEAPLFIVSAVTTALFPAAARLFVQDRNKLKGLTRQAFQGIIPIGLTVSVPAAFFSDEIIQLIYGAKYSGAGPALSILIFSLSIIMPSTILGTTIRAIGFQTASAWVTGMGAVLNIVSNIAVIPYYSYIGASWTTLLTEVFVLIAYFSLASRYLGYFLDRWFPARVLAYVAGLELMLLATRAWGMWIQSGVFFVVFPVWMLVLGLVDPAITNRLRQKFRPAGKET